MRFLELFAGAGGLSLGLERAGLRCVGHAEIAPHARAVLRHHWPEVPLWGDVAALAGADLPAHDLLSGGSPCQDLSVAGKREGLVDGARSSLFFHQARIWREGGAPYFLWENVHGALSSQSGRDFALVLSTLVGTALPVPADGWAGGGVAAGPEAVAAWRVCDLQYFGGGGFGPPQRRVRVFVLAARAGGADPAEILALSESLCGHPDPRTAAGEGAAGATGASVAGSLTCQMGHTNRVDGHECYPVQSVTHADSIHTLDGYGSYNGRRPTLRASGGDTGGGGEAIVVTGNCVTHALTGEGCDASEDGTGRGTPLCVQPIAYDDRNQAASVDLHHTLRSEGIGARVSDAVVQPIITFTAEMSLQSTDENLMHTLQTVVTPATLQPWPDVAPTLDARDAKGPGNFHNGELQATVVQERPRRLMPLECERLMGWPDEHTARGIDEQGRAYALKDTPRYALCGNGVGAPVAEWIGRRLMQAPPQPPRGAEGEG